MWRSVPSPELAVMVSNCVPSGVPVVVPPLLDPELGPPFRLFVESTVLNPHPPAARVTQHTSNNATANRRVRWNGMSNIAVNIVPAPVHSCVRDARTIFPDCASVVTVSVVELPVVTVAG